MAGTLRTLECCHEIRSAITGAMQWSASPGSRLKCEIDFLGWNQTRCVVPCWHAFTSGPDFGWHAETGDAYERTRRPIT